MSRCLLHITKLDEFKKFLDKEGLQHRDGRGEWQVLQVCKDGKHWNNVYSRLNMPEHFTTDRHLDNLVAKFCRQDRNKNDVSI